MVARAASSDDETLIGEIVSEHLGQHAQPCWRSQATRRRWRATAPGWRSLFRGKIAALGYEPQPGEPVETARLRASVLSALANDARDPEAIAQARALQEREASNPAGVDPNLAPVAIGAAARRATRRPMTASSRSISRARAASSRPIRSNAMPARSRSSSRRS